MIKVAGLEKIAAIVDATDKIKEINKKAKDNKIAEMVAEGIDKEIASVMYDAFKFANVNL